MNIRLTMDTRATLLRGWALLGTEARSQWEFTELVLDDSSLRRSDTIVQRATMRERMRQPPIMGTQLRDRRQRTTLTLSVGHLIMHGMPSMDLWEPTHILVIRCLCTDTTIPIQGILQEITHLTHLSKNGQRLQMQTHLPQSDGNRPKSTKVQRRRQLCPTKPSTSKDYNHRHPMQEAEVNQRKG